MRPRPHNRLGAPSEWVLVRPLPCRQFHLPS